MRIKAVCYFLFLFLIYVFPIMSQSFYGTDFKAIDEAALSISDSHARSVGVLAKALTHTAKNDVEKVRALYTWIVHNITYDFESLVEQTRFDNAVEVLSRRKGVCYGYSNLFTAMARKAGIEAHTVIGTVKRAHPETEDPGHAWNAVQINGEWLLLDTTWRRFLTEPESFIKTYYPMDQERQYLLKPVSKKDFDNQLAAGQAFYDCNMTLIDPPVLDFNADQKTTITLGVPAGVIVTASMGKKSDKKLPGRTVGWDESWSLELTEPLLLVHRKGETVEIEALFPEPGLWYIGVQAGWEGKKRRGAVSINVTVDTGLDKDVVFPETNRDLTRLDFYLDRPRERFLKAGEIVTFSVESEQAAAVAVVSNGLHRLEKNETVFSGDIKLTAGTVYIAADLDGSGSYWNMVKFEAR